MFPSVEEAEKIKNYHIERQTEFDEAVEIGKKLGVSVELDSNIAGNGIHTSDGRIIINPNTENPALQVFVHELTHDIETSGLYANFSEKILSHVSENYDVDKIRQMVIEDYKAAGHNLTNTQANAEIVAKYCEQHLFTDEKAIQRLLDTDRSLFQKIKDWIHDMIVKFKGAPEERFLLEAERLYEKALATRGKVAGTGAEQFSIVNIPKHGQGVLLDTNIFDNKAPREWNKVLQNYVYKNFAGKNVTVFDEKGNSELIYFAKTNDRVTKDGAKNSHKVLDKIARTNGDNIKALEIVHLPELLQVTQNEKTTDENNHQWLDKNGWIHREAYIVDRKGNVYVTTLNIADGRDRKILYALSNTKRIDSGAVPSIVSNRGSLTYINPEDTLSQTKPVVNNEDYINSGSKAVMTKNRIDYLIEDSGAGNRQDYAKEWITSISPTDFLKLTTDAETQNRENFDNIGSEWDPSTNMNNYDY